MKITRLLGTFALTYLLSLATLTARASDFEGTLKWKISTEITDPEMKAQMSEARQEMADPEKLAEMKAMMADPQMKAMMEQNPQMKAMMEAQIKNAENPEAGGDLLSTMMPKSMTVRSKGGKSHLSTEGGAMPMEVISTTEPPVSYWIDRKAGTYSKLPAEDTSEPADAPKATVSKGPRSTKILGYTCEEYIVEMKTEDSTVRGIVWATDDIPGLDSKALAKSRLGGQESAYLDQIDGVPLKMEMTLPEMKMTMSATAVTPGKVPDSVFEIPAGLRETPFAPGLPAASMR